MAEQHRKGSKKVKNILILAAHPHDTDPLRLDREVREIDEGLRRSRHRDQFNLVQKWAVRTEDLRRVFLDEAPYIVHFCGRGEPLIHMAPSSNRQEILIPGEAQAIVLEEADGHRRTVGADVIADIFGLVSDGIGTVVLNGCYAESQADAISQHVPYVIGINRAAGEKAAVAFSDGFYDGIGAGKSIEQAFQVGCHTVRQVQIPESLVPILKKNEEVLARQEEAQAKDAQRGEGITTLEPESMRQKLSIWLSILAAAVTILMFAFDLPQKLQGITQPESARLWGIVINGNDEPVAGALIEVRSEEGAPTRIGEFTTNSDGTFSFIVKSQSEASVWVTVSKDERVGLDGYMALLGNKRILFEGTP